MTNQKVDDCLPCKITSICCLFGIGNYLVYTSKGQIPPYKYSLVLLGLGCIGLGIGEIYDKSPFRGSKETDLSIRRDETEK